MNARLLIFSCGKYSIHLSGGFYAKYWYGLYDFIWQGADVRIRQRTKSCKLVLTPGLSALFCLTSREVESIESKRKTIRNIFMEFIQVL